MGFAARVEGPGLKPLSIRARIRRAKALRLTPKAKAKAFLWPGDGLHPTDGRLRDGWGTRQLSPSYEYKSRSSAFGEG